MNMDHVLKGHVPKILGRVCCQTTKKCMHRWVNQYSGKQNSGTMSQVPGTVVPGHRHRYGSKSGYFEYLNSLNSSLTTMNLPANQGQGLTTCTRSEIDYFLFTLPLSLPLFISYHALVFQVSTKRGSVTTYGRYCSFCFSYYLSNIMFIDPGRFASLKIIAIR